MESEYACVESLMIFRKKEVLLVNSNEHTVQWWQQLRGQTSFGDGS